jgi:uncharacterized membrane protein (DUF2068 family)
VTEAQARAVPARAAGLQAIIAYKLVKAVLEALVGVLMIYLLVSGAEAGAASLAEVLLEHSARAWALKAATLLIVTATTRHVELAAAGAFVDALLSAVEGLALRAGKWWAPWLVVFATGALLPWELIEIVRRPDWVRVLLLVLNLAVVVYLIRGVRKHEVRSQPVDSLPGDP